MKQIVYIKKPTKFRVEEEYSAMTGIVGYEGETPLIRLYLTGRLVISVGFGFDPSGPTIDTDSAIRGACEHDAFFELMWRGLIPLALMDVINDRLETVCKEDGMFDIRAELWDEILDVAGTSSADPDKRPRLRKSPKD